MLAKKHYVLLVSVSARTQISPNSLNKIFVLGDVSMATVGSAIPPPVKNDWLSSALDNPKLSPPSPGGPRKATPMTAVKLLEINLS